MIARKQIHDGLFLMRPWGDALGVLHPAEEAVKNRVGVKIAAFAVMRGKRPKRSVSVRSVGFQLLLVLRHTPESNAYRALRAMGPAEARRAGAICPQYLGVMRRNHRMINGYELILRLG